MRGNDYSSERKLTLLPIMIGELRSGSRYCSTFKPIYRSQPKSPQRAGNEGSVRSHAKLSEPSWRFGQASES